MTRIRLPPYGNLIYQQLLNNEFSNPDFVRVYIGRAAWYRATSANRKYASNRTMCLPYGHHMEDYDWPVSNLGVIVEYTDGFLSKEAADKTAQILLCDGATMVLACGVKKPDGEKQNMYAY